MQKLVVLVQNRKKALSEEMSKQLESAVKKLSEFMTEAQNQLSADVQDGKYALHSGMLG